MKKAKAAFGGDSENMPSATIPQGMTRVADILVAVGAAPSKGEAKRLIIGGGISVDDVKITAFDASLSEDILAKGFVLHKGKKTHIKVSVE